MSDPWAFWPALGCVIVIPLALWVFGLCLLVACRTRDWKAAGMIAVMMAIYGGLGWAGVLQLIESW